jgi:hypothetical protein
MDHVGIDVHKKDRQICIVAEGGELIERRVRMEGLGHEVVVADPNFAPMYATRRRTVKTDRRTHGRWPTHEGVKMDIRVQRPARALQRRHHAGLPTVDAVRARAAPVDVAQAARGILLRAARS